MTLRIPKTPSYRLHKPSGQAVVRLEGRDYYLGKYGTEASQEAYKKANRRRLTTPRLSPASPTEVKIGLPLSIDEFMLAYWDRHVATYYVKNGRPTSEQDNIRQALRFLRRLYGGTQVKKFSPLALKAVRHSMIEAGRSRKLINKDINRIKRTNPINGVEERGGGVKERRKGEDLAYPAQRVIHASRSLSLRFR